MKQAQLQMLDYILKSSGRWFARQLIFAKAKTICPQDIIPERK